MEILDPADQDEPRPCELTGHREDEAELPALAHHGADGRQGEGQPQVDLRVPGLQCGPGHGRPLPLPSPGGGNGPSASPMARRDRKPSRSIASATSSRSTRISAGASTPTRILSERMSTIVTRICPSMMMDSPIFRESTSTPHL